MLLNVPWRTKFPLIKNHWSPLLVTKMFKKTLNCVTVHPEIIFRKIQCLLFFNTDIPRLKRKVSSAEGDQRDLRIESSTGSSHPAIS